jgi:hypothetical protein
MDTVIQGVGVVLLVAFAVFAVLANRGRRG